jgi:hypothetical protein
VLGAHISPLVGIHLFGVLLASSWFGEPRLLTCSRACPQPLVRRAPAGAQSPARSCRAPRARPQPLVRRAPSSARVSVAAAASACCLCAATSLPLQLPPLASRAPSLLRHCSCLRAVFCSLRSARCVFCAALCVAISLHCVRFPQFAICALCSVTCAVPSGSCQPGCARAKLRFFRVRSPAISLHVQAVGSRGLIT